LWNLSKQSNQSNNALVEVGGFYDQMLIVRFEIFTQKSIMAFLRNITLFLCVGLFLIFGTAGFTETFTPKEIIAEKIEPPYQIGETVDEGLYEIVNLDGRVAGYAFETLPKAAIPGFSGAPINLLVIIDNEGTFINAEILSHNEPIFISGLDGRLFHNFVEQYKGKSVFDTMVVGVPYGGKDEASSLIYLDGVTKATASVRIAHETILAASFAIAKDKLQNIASGPPAKPNTSHTEDLTWQDLVTQGIATRRLVTNSELQAAFHDTLWQDDDPEATENPDAPYLDLWVVDIGAPSIAKAVLDDYSLAELEHFMSISRHDEPLLIIDAGRHGLVRETFIRNTSPDLIEAHQDGFPISLRDSDIEVELKSGIPSEYAMILRTDRRIGFDPTRDWVLSIKAVREHGSFRPEIGTVEFKIDHKTPERFYVRETPPKPEAPWVSAIKSRKTDLAILFVFLMGLFIIQLRYLRGLSSQKKYTPMRIGTLAFVVGFIGWWGQGQLSIVTPIGVIRGVIEGKSLLFLLYDPFSLLIWIFTFISFFLWGRGLFCGWLCPFGAMQEFMHHIGRLLRLPQLRVPNWLDQKLILSKYFILAGLLILAITAPNFSDKAVEVEPFKTAITTLFVREWYYVAYAVFLLLSSMVLFKGFCRYICPLGAIMAIGGLIRGRDWIERRADCGSPCQLCKVKCNYNAIKPTGEIAYSECFQCLDCVTIFEDDKQCVPLVLAAKREARK
jgi:transcriptional regulator of nitric oxide reductase